MTQAARPKSIINRYDFQIILAGVSKILHDSELIEKYSPFILEDYICYQDDNPEPKALRFILKTMKNYKKAFRAYTIESFKVYLKTDANKLSPTDSEWVSAIFGKLAADPIIKDKLNDENTFQMFLDYLKLIQIASLSKELFDNYEKGKPDAATERMAETINDINQITSEKAKEFNPGQIYANLSKKNERLVGDRVINLGGGKLGGNTLDAKLGGFKPKTLNLFVGLTNTGKSQMAYHILRRCVAEKMYAHITVVEDTEETFIERIVSCLTDIPIRIVADPSQWSDTHKALIKKAENDITTYIGVDFVYGQSIDVVHKRKLDYDLKRSSKGLPPATVDIVDYTGHIAGKSFGDKKFEKMISAYTARKDFALENKKIAFDFAQVNREGGKKAATEKSVLTITELAGAFDISHVCDTIISINRNEEDEVMNRTRLHVCKSRNGEKGGTFTYKVDFSRSRQYLEDGDEETSDFGRNKAAGVRQINEMQEQKVNKFRDVEE